MALTVTESKWHGCRYHVVEIEHEWDPAVWQHSWRNMETWCVDKLGSPGDPWDMTPAQWYMNGGKFYFRNHNDLMLFLIRWT